MTKQQFNDLSEKYLNVSSSTDEEKILFAWYEALQKKQVVGEPVSAEEKNKLFSELKSLLDNKEMVSSSDSSYPNITKYPAVKTFIFTGHLMAKSLKRMVDIFHFNNGFAYRKEESRK